MSPVVVLVGPPGSGKTTVGQALATLTGHDLRDTDDDIVTQEGRSIADIFTQDGEPYFRVLERAAVAAALAEHAGIVAVGGGAVLAPETQAALAGQPVVFLAVTMPVGVRRTGLNGVRPLLVGINPRATYASMLEARIPVYRQVSQVEIMTDALTPEEIAAEIADRLVLR